MGQTVVEKIAQAHMAEGPSDRPLRAGDFLSIRPHHVMTHDNTSPVMAKFKAIGAPRVKHPGQPVFILDHDIQNRSEGNLAKYRAIESFAGEQGVDFYPAGTGIGHQVLVEQQYVAPGTFVVASDSHSNMYGGVGAIGTPVVRTDAAAIWATGVFWWQIPRTIRVTLEGQLPAGVTGKDVIIALCGLYNQGEVLNAVVEFGGPGVATLSMDERLSIANMTTEWGALVGWFPVDDVTLTFIRERREILASRGQERITAAQIEGWREQPPQPDADATYAGSITLDLTDVNPHVCGPDSVQLSTVLGEMESRQIKIHKAYLVSCVNSRLEDIAAAAKVLGGRKVAPGVELYIAAASLEIQNSAQQLGHWQALLDAGARPLPPGCGPCIGLGTGLLEAGEVGISATNRNFKGRMGSRDAQCYLASPAVIAASAIAGYICGPESSPTAGLTSNFKALETAAVADERVEILPGFPEKSSGRLVFVSQDNMNTDGIYGKDYTYRDDMTSEMMAGVVFENYDPTFATTVERGDVLLGGMNFGTGSSREQAITALQAKGIALIIAGSYSQTYLRNAFNNGFTCVECPELLAHVREVLASQIEAGEKTILSGDEIEVDFSVGAISFRGTTFRFPPLGVVPQALVVAGGVENQVREALGLGS
jgi:homoaconitate hydratase